MWTQEKGKRKQPGKQVGKQTDIWAISEQQN